MSILKDRLLDQCSVYVDIDWHIAHDGGEGPHQESLLTMLCQ